MSAGAITGTWALALAVLENCFKRYGRTVVVIGRKVIGTSTWAAGVHYVYPHASVDTPILYRRPIVLLMQTSLPTIDFPAWTTLLICRWKDRRDNTEKQQEARVGARKEDATIHIYIYVRYKGGQ